MEEEENVQRPTFNVQRSNGSHSLLLAPNEEAEMQARQLFLFHSDDLARLAIDRGKPKFHCTGERLFRDRPDVYRLVVSMRAEDLPYRLIERACHVTDDTIKAVEAREAVPIAEEKKRSLRVAARANRMLAERIEELAPTMKAGEATLAYGVTFDKVAVASGDPTQRIDLVPKTDTRSLLEKLNEELEAKLLEMKRAKAIEVGPARIESGNQESRKVEEANA